MTICNWSHFLGQRVLLCFHLDNSISVRQWHKLPIPCTFHSAFVFIHECFVRVGLLFLSWSFRVPCIMLTSLLLLLQPQSNQLFCIESASDSYVYMQLSNTAKYWAYRLIEPAIIRSLHHALLEFTVWHDYCVTTDSREVSEKTDRLVVSVCNASSFAAKRSIIFKVTAYVRLN